MLPLFCVCFSLLFVLLVLVWCIGTFELATMHQGPPEPWEAQPFVKARMTVFAHPPHDSNTSKQQKTATRPIENTYSQNSFVCIVVSRAFGGVRTHVWKSGFDFGISSSCYSSMGHYHLQGLRLVRRKDATGIYGQMYHQKTCIERYRSETLGVLTLYGFCRNNGTPVSLFPCRFT